MAIDLPINAPLTDAQGELTAKIGSMKSLLALPSINKRNIPKANQISTYDYLLKILESMGLNPEVIFNSFLTKIFDTTGTFLEDKVLDAISDSIGEQGIQLSPYINNIGASTQDKKQYKVANKSFIRGFVPNTFLQVVKQDLAKKLVLMIFGKNTALQGSINPPMTNSDADYLVSNAVCGEGLFTMSNDPIVRNQDLEYNRIQLRQQLEKGQVVYQISCQDVKITLPVDPGFIFTGGGQFTVPGSVVTPAQSLNFMVQYVNNQVQRINNETNANKGGKKFHQILIEKLLSFISVLVQPYLPNVFTLINSQLLPAQQISQVNFVFSNCDIQNTPADVTKQEFSRSLFNALLKDLLKLLLSFVIKKFKQMVANYFARTAIEKQKRKLQKAQMKFQIFSKIAANADKIQKYQAALSTLNGVLGGVS